ncbi:hypothetical protein DBR06_SOUSAS4710060, partial [Sousa chinensis]
ETTYSIIPILLLYGISPLNCNWRATGLGKLEGCRFFLW